jgi:hypothetical protein
VRYTILLHIRTDTEIVEIAGVCFPQKRIAISKKYPPVVVGGGGQRASTRVLQKVRAWFQGEQEEMFPKHIGVVPCVHREAEKFRGGRYEVTTTGQLSCHR